MEGTTTRSFRKAVKIKRSQEISLLIKSGSRWDCDVLRIYSIPNGFNRSRYAILVPRQCGNAVFRNKIKRTVREILRNNNHLAPIRRNILIRIFPKKTKGTMRELESSLKKWFEKLKK